MPFVRWNSYCLLQIWYQIKNDSNQLCPEIVYQKYIETIMAIGCHFSINVYSSSHRSLNCGMLQKYFVSFNLSNKKVVKHIEFSLVLTWMMNTFFWALKQFIILVGLYITSLIFIKHQINFRLIFYGILIMLKTKRACVVSIIP